MEQTKLSREFLKMKIGKQITFAPDAPIYCPHCVAHGRRSSIIKRDMPYVAKYLGRQDVDGTTCDVLYIHSGPQCQQCGYEIYSIYFPTRTGKPILIETDKPVAFSGDVTSDDSGGDRLRDLLVTLALVGVLLLALLAQSGR